MFKSIERKDHESHRKHLDTIQKSHEKSHEKVSSSKLEGTLLGDSQTSEIVLQTKWTRIIQRIKELWSRFLFMPMSPFKFKWDVLIIVLSVWNSFEIPFTFAFPEDEIYNAGNTFDTIVDLLFAFDIIINFRTGYIDPKTDTLIMDTSRISANYIKGRFWVDLVASIPFEFLTVILSTDRLKIIGMLKLVRLMRLGRMVTFLKANKSFKLSIILIQLLFILILVIHWIACLWKVVVQVNHSWNPPKDMDWSETEVYTASVMIRYNTFFYYSVLTLVSNELMPTTDAELQISILILLIGSLTISVLIGEFSSILQDMGRRDKKLNEEFDMVQSVMVGLKLPEEI